MESLSRRDFGGALAGAAASAPAVGTPAGIAATGETRTSLDGNWQFRLDSSSQWSEVTVPHTWQVSPESSGYMGVAWYRRQFDAPADWGGKTVRIEFEAIFHTAELSLNERPIGVHRGQGYAAFTLDLTSALKPGAVNTILIKVDNSFDENMLPRGNSYDWTPDGGIIRPVSLITTPHAFIEQIEVDADPKLTEPAATVDVRLAVRNAGNGARQVRGFYEITEEATGRIVLRGRSAGLAIVRPNSTESLQLPPAQLPNPRLWHFDHPHLYRIRAWIEAAGQKLHSATDTFGIRKIEARNGGIYLNGERVRLMGVERMAGSNPRIRHGRAGRLDRPRPRAIMKELNCVFTRVHWPQDRRVLDYCDRHGILIQTEVPTWGRHTFEGMREEPSAAIMDNGLEQLREMIAARPQPPVHLLLGPLQRDQRPEPARLRVRRRMYDEAKKLDPHRLATYASNSLEKTPGATTSPA